MTSRAQRLITAARSPLPEGTFAVGAGLLVAGLTAYGFQIIAYRALDKAQYAALNGLWVMVFVVAPGFFQPLEQEVSRALAHRRAQGIGGGPLARRAALLGGILAAIAVVATLVTSPQLVDELFHGEWMLLGALLVAIVSYYLAHMVRGVLSGNARFGAYGMLIGSEGIVRVAAAAALLVVGVEVAGPFGFALALPPVVAVAVALRAERGLLTPGPPAPYSELSTALGWLLLGSVLAQALSYASFLGATILATPDQRDQVADFIAGLFLARIPILLFQAVQAALLPRLANLAGAGRHSDFRAGLRKLVVIVVGLGVTATLAALALGPWAGALLFGDKFVLGRQDLALLAAGSGAFILALTLAQGLIALRGYRGTAIAWLAGVAAFLVATVPGQDLFLRVETGFLAGSLVAAACMGRLLVLRMRRGVPEDAVADLVGVLEHEPLEI